MKNTVVALVAIGILVAPVAFGHARLKNSSPASHAQLSESPRTLTLIFDEKVKLAVLVHLGVLGGNRVAGGQKTNRPRSTNALFQAVSRH
jgi:methionine-rich copper-binding protein CopC